MTRKRRTLKEINADLKQENADLIEENNRLRGEIEAYMTDRQFYPVPEIFIQMLFDANKDKPANK